MSTPDPLALSFWRISPHHFLEDRRFQNWFGFCVSYASPAERTEIDRWLMFETRHEDRVRQRTKMIEQYQERIGAYSLPSFSVWLRRREDAIRLQSKLASFEPRPFEAVLAQDEEGVPPDVFTYIRRVKGRWTVPAQHGKIVSMPRTRESEAAMILLRLFGN